MPRKDDTTSAEGEANLGELIRSIVRQELVRLRDDDSPILKTHLDANGKDILDAGNVQCRSINGREPDAPARLLVEQESARSDQTYARLRHGHGIADISGLRQLFEEVVTEAIPTDYAKADHWHSLDQVDGIWPLLRLELGEEIRALLTRKLSDASHTHPELHDELHRLERLLQGLRADVDSLRAALPGLSTEIVKAVDLLDEKVRAVAARIPEQKPEPPVELLGNRYTIVPFKADGRKIRRVTAADPSGTPVDVEITCGSKTLEEGDTVHAGEVLHFSPSCLVCIELS